MRRKLIVVSNRGPVSYGRGPDGTRTAKRGGGGLVTALRSLVQYHDVTWIASAITDEDRIAAGETLEETSRDGSPYRVRLVAHDPQAYDWYYNVVANPMLWFVHHSLWDLAVQTEARRCVSPRLAGRVRRGQRELRGRGRRRAVAHARRRRLLPRLSPVPRAAAGAGAPAGRRTHALRPRSLAAA